MKKDKWIIITVSFVLPLIVCLILKLWFDHILYDIDSFDGVDIAKTLLSSWATLLGFIVTAASILITMNGKEYIQAFKKSKHYNTVLLTYCLTSFTLLIATIFCIVVMCLNTWNVCLFYILIYLIISTSLLLFFCIVFLSFMILKSI